MKKLIVLIMCGPKVRTSDLPFEKFLERARTALNGLPLKIEYRAAVDAGAHDARAFLTELEVIHPDLVLFVAPHVESTNNVEHGASRYIHGLEKACLESDFVLEIDEGGAHDPSDMRKFVEALLEGKAAVLSNRFMRGGKHLYPFKRKIASLAISLLANAVLRLPRFVSDMASGFEAFDSKLLKDIFVLKPPATWITLKTTTVFIQTELRAYMLWYLAVCGTEQKTKILPIVYGAEKRGLSFPSGVGRRALKGLFLLWAQRSKFIKSARQLKSRKDH